MLSSMLLRASHSHSDVNAIVNSAPGKNHSFLMPVSMLLIAESIDSGLKSIAEVTLFESYSVLV